MKLLGGVFERYWRNLERCQSYTYADLSQLAPDVDAVIEWVGQSFPSPISGDGSGGRGRRGARTALTGRLLPLHLPPSHGRELPFAKATYHR